MPRPDEISVMGIINLTDDSFYSGSRLLNPQGKTDTASAVGMARAHIEGGASILDIGACSTRPGSVPVSEKEEWSRLEPALLAIRETFPDISISVDTFRSGIARKCHSLIGGFIVNDISAGEDDADMLDTVGSLGLGYVAMHKRGTPATMQSLTDYEPLDPHSSLSPVTQNVLEYFRKFASRASACGIRDWILDPGFGFSKTIGQNYELLRELSHLSILGRPVLAGISRKSMIYKYLNITPEESLPATSALHMEALRGGAAILRVHDAAEATRCIRLFRAVSGQV